MTPTSEGHWTSIRGHAPALAGLPCCIELRIARELAGIMVIEENGEVRIADEGEAAALIALDDQETLVDLLRGDFPPIVAHLQGRLRFEGDADLALRVLFALQEGSPWSASIQRGTAS